MAFFDFVKCILQWWNSDLETLLKCGTLVHVLYLLYILHTYQVLSQHAVPNTNQTKSMEFDKNKQKTCKISLYLAVCGWLVERHKNKILNELKSNQKKLYNLTIIQQSTAWEGICTSECVCEIAILWIAAITISVVNIKYFFLPSHSVRHWGLRETEDKNGENPFVRYLSK